MMMMNLRTMIFRWLALPVIVSVSAFYAQASPIIVTNFSFETLPAGGLTNDACGLACACSIAPIPGWITGPNAGQVHPGTQCGNTAWVSTLSYGITTPLST